MWNLESFDDSEVLRIKQTDQPFWINSGRGDDKNGTVIVKALANSSDCGTPLLDDGTKTPGSKSLTITD